MVDLSFFRGRDVRVRGHDRYAIYRMIGCKVEFASPNRRAGRLVSGVVEDVARNIFDNEVQIFLKGGKVFRFKEPTAILKDTGSVVFWYGDVGHKEVGDEAMFQEMRMSQYGETVNDVLKRTEGAKVKATRFVVLDEAPRRRGVRAL